MRNKIGRCRITTFRQNTDFNVGLTPDLHAKQRGFTLIELLVVVLIIGILAAVALPQYQLAVDKSRIKAVLPVIRHIVNAEEIYKMANGNYTLDFRELVVDLPMTYMNNEGYLLSTPSGDYMIGDGGTYPYVLAFPWGVVAGKPYVYRALFVDLWLCYPAGTDRGRKLCKSLGCSNVNADSCPFTP